MLPLIRKHFFISVIIFVSFLGSEVYRFSIREIYSVLGNLYLCVMDVDKAIKMSSSASHIPGRNVSHGLVLPGSQDKILPQGETEKSLMFVYHSARTNLP